MPWRMGDTAAGRGSVTGRPYSRPVGQAAPDVFECLPVQEAADSRSDTLVWHGLCSVVHGLCTGRRQRSGGRRRHGRVSQKKGTQTAHEFERVDTRLGRVGPVTGCSLQSCYRLLSSIMTCIPHPPPFRCPHPAGGGQGHAIGDTSLVRSWLCWRQCRGLGSSSRSSGVSKGTRV